MNRLLFVIGIGGATLWTRPALPAPSTEESSGERRVVRPFELKQVHLLDGLFLQDLERNRAYLLGLDLERQLHTFRLTAGLPTTAQPLGGWEAPGDMGRGEFFGHSLSARAMLYAATGDERLKKQLDYLVAELAKCQAALGSHGYLHAEPETIFDRLEAGENVQGLYYAVHKLMAGLLDMYHHCGNRQALEIASRMGDWVHERAGRFPPERWEKILNVEFGGLNEALYNLYAITHKPSHLQAARRFDHERIYRPLAEGRDELKGLHANTTIPKIIGAARAYEVTGDPRFRQVAEYFWRQVAQKRSYATGGTSNYEFWRTPAGELAAELSEFTQECCCTYNMLKLTRHVLTWTGLAQAGDFYERALFNGVLGTMDPQSGLTMYHVALAGGCYKTFATPLDSFWCCTGTGVESFAKPGDSIYFHDDTALWVNLFIASELEWPEKGLKLTQQTRFPEQPGVRLRFTVKQPVEMTLRFRVPYWARLGASVKLNGAPLKMDTAPASYAALQRTWQDQDVLELEMPMSLHLEPMPDNPAVAAILYGPLVLAGRLGPLTPAEAHNHNAASGGLRSSVPWFAVEDENLAAWIKPIAGQPLEFRTEDQATNVSLAPLCSLFGEHYAVYWTFLKKGSQEHHARLAEAVRQQRLPARTVDAIEMGDTKSESAHGLAGLRTESGAGSGRRWRHAFWGGWFSYQLKVLPDQPMVLHCTYWGGDVPPRRFDLLVDGKRLTTQNLDRNRPGEFFDLELPVPDEMTRGKERVTVKFQAHDGNTAGGLFGLRMLKADL
jgi:uncharacterized protein